MRRALRVLGAVPLAVAALSAADAGAQTIYRSTMPDGRVILGDRPMPGAKKVDEIQVKPVINTAPGDPAAGQSGQGAGRGEGGDGPRRSRGSESRGGSGQSELARAQAELDAAQRAYDSARTAVESGKEPQPGERTGTAKGGSRLNEDYDKRQQELQDQLGAAQRRLDAARAAVNAAR